MLFFIPITSRNRIVFVLFFFLSCFGYSQEVQVDPKFNSYDDGLLGDGFDGTVRTLSIQNDGKLIVGGEFLNYNGSTTPYLCRLQTDGSKDVGFNLGAAFNGKIYASVIQPDGKIIVAGAFTTYNGIPAGRLVRLNIDGSRDISFDTTNAVSSGTVYGLALQTDGKLLVVGSFTKYNGTTANRIARLNPNGELDTSFVTGTAATSTIDDVAVAPDGKIVLSGTFSAFNGNSNYPKLVRLNTDGSIDTTFSIGTGFDDTIEAIAVQPDGKIIVGGSFLNYKGISQNRIVRLNTNGAVDSSFLSGTGFNDGVVHTIQITSAGILVGGSFSDTYKMSDVNRLVLLNSNGTINSNFDIGAGPFSATIYTLCESSDSFFVGGSFSVFDDLKQGKLAKISITGELDSGYLTAGVGFDKAVEKVIPLTDGTFIAFGSFTQFNGQPINNIVKLTPKGELDNSYNLNQTGADNTVKEVLVQPDGKFLVAGNFIKYNGVSNKRLVRLNSNGTIDTSLNIGTGFNYTVYSIALQPDGKIIAAGSFTTFRGLAVNKVIRLLSNGNLDPSFTIGANPNSTPNLLLLQSDGKILVGGDFTTFNGVASNKLVRLNSDGSVDTSFSVGTGFDGKVYAFTLQNDNKILVGGSFSNYNGQPNKRILRLNSNGSQDSSFNSGSGFSNGIVRSILLQSNGNILVGGSFSSKYNGINVKRMLRLLPNGSYDTSFPIVLNGELKSLCLVPGGAIIGGNFNSVSGISKHRIAKLLFCQDGTVWDGLTWSNGMPTIDKAVVFNANFDIMADTKACSCVVNSGKTLTVKNAATLELVSNYSGAGKLVFENNSSLYQSDDLVVNTGSIEFNRKTTPIRKSDYTYWSSPVAGQQLNVFAPDSPSDRFYSFDANSNNWHKESNSATMVVGKGYIFQAPQTFSETIPTVFESVFSGIPNNGFITIPIAKNATPNLIGNPYPSALDADAFILENQSILQGSLYFWTHNTPIANGQYTSDDYAVYTILGGVGTSSISMGVNNEKPNGKIAAGQAFFVLGANPEGGNAIFKNEMRLKGQNNLFFKSSLAQKIITSSSIEKHRFWLNLSNKQGMFKQILIGYVTGATNEKDILFDGVALDGNEWLDFYSLDGEVKNAIQGRSLPFNTSDSVSLGYRAKQEGNFTISLDDFDGLFANQNIFLEDKERAKIVDLKKDDYIFTTVKGTFDNRFVLRYENQNIIPEELAPEVKVVCRNNQIQISSSVDLIEEVRVYSLEGKLLFQADKLETKTQIIDSALWKSKILIIQITLATGEQVTHKLVF
jgi:uncharacterized delta-60 repeat protein